MLKRCLFSAGLTILLAAPLAAVTRPALIVLNKSDNELVIVDLNTKRVTGRVPVGMGPHEVVTSTDGATAFVAFSVDNTIGILDLKSLTFVDKVSTGAVPDGMAILK